jgi:hypothetical protein
MTALLESKRRTIRERADAGLPLDRIEAEVIDSAPWLEGDSRAALWLWAWHCCAGERAPGAHELDRLPGAA